MNLDRSRSMMKSIYGKAGKMAVSLTFLGLLIFPVGALANHEVIQTQEGNKACTMTTFENAPHFQPIHPDNGYLIPGTEMRFPGPWRTLTSGTYQNNPSGLAVVIWVDSGGTSAEVTFDQPVSSVSFFFASLPDVTLEAYDVGSNLVATATSPGNAALGGFVVWDPIEVDSGANNISSVVVIGNWNRTALDDFTYCRVEGIDTSIDIMPGTDLNKLNLCSRGVVPVAILGSAEVDVNKIVFETVQLAGSGVKLRGNADYLYSFRDVDGDGRTDVIVYIEVENLDLTSGDSLATLTGELSDGTPIFGTDSINIVRDDCP
jgi:hypothetical protein